MTPNIGLLHVKCRTRKANETRQSEMANTSPATCQCLATFTPLKYKILIFFRDVISLRARVFIFLIDSATQEVPMKEYFKEMVGPVFEIYAIELLGSMSI